jgi:hypothetical protein
MKPLLSALLMLAGAMTASAAQDDADKPNTLTRKEIAEGWLLLFDGETTFGWKVEGEAKVKDALLVLGGEKRTTATMEFGYFEASWQLRWDGKAGPRRVVQSLTGEKQDGEVAGDFSYASAAGGKGLWSTERWRVQPDEKVVANSGSEVKGDLVTGTSADTTIRFQPNRRIVVRLEVPAGTKLYLRNVKLRSTELLPLFNGRDLMGWKEVITDRTKSKFTVTDRGELSIKNGPGDLQSENQYADFVLQLDCKSNGDHLNSGVFFRCLPGQFWSGYEAQIRNQWKGDDRTKPVDYGTGGIYNRQPARKVVSSDREWFTMTIIAQGKHLAVWVNGYQTADFTDPRPLNESARKGSKTDKGPISLQGHDPTTDLLFRNIRIAELPRAEEK